MSSTTIRYSGVPENSHSHRSNSDGSAYTGLRRRGDGFYDWAGRRLLLADGSPDPMTPGAYRYQHSPDLCDPAAPEADPDSPRYEPPHLRHQPGDTWEIGGKPRDPDDPGVFGSPGWRPDSAPADTVAANCPTRSRHSIAMRKPNAPFTAARLRRFRAARGFGAARVGRLPGGRKSTSRRRETKCRMTSRTGSRSSAKTPGASSSSSPSRSPPHTSPPTTRLSRRSNASAGRSCGCGSSSSAGSSP